MRNIALITILFVALPAWAQDPKQEPTPAPAQAPTLEKPQMAPQTEEKKPVEKPKAPPASKVNPESAKPWKRLLHG